MVTQCARRGDWPSHTRNILHPMNSLIPRLSCLLHLKLPLPLLARLLLARLRAAATGRLRAARCPHTLALDWQGGVTWTTKATGPTPTTSTASRASTGRATIAVRRSSVPLVQHAAVHAYARSAPRNLPPPLSHAHGNRNPPTHRGARVSQQNETKHTNHTTPSLQSTAENCVSPSPLTSRLVCVGASLSAQGCTRARATCSRCCATRAWTW
jgi:hypothetical protein